MASVVMDFVDEHIDNIFVEFSRRYGHVALVQEHGIHVVLPVLSVAFIAFWALQLVLLLGVSRLMYVLTGKVLNGI